MKKFAVIGRGKTGSAVLTQLSRTEVIGPFSRSEPPTIAALGLADAAIVFVPADAFEMVLPTLLSARIPAVIGTTGYPFTPALNQQVLDAKTAWIVGSNFSPGMNLLMTAAKLLSRNLDVLGECQTQIREWHHAQKKDSPSGTALTLKALVDNETQKQTPVQAFREGEHRGLHDLQFRAEGEILSLRHEALDRSIFARGAIAAARELLPQLAPGIHHYETLMEQRLLERVCKN